MTYDKSTDTQRVRVEFTDTDKRTDREVLEFTRWQLQADGRWLRETAWFLATRSARKLLPQAVRVAPDKHADKVFAVAKTKGFGYQRALVNTPREFFAGVRLGEAAEPVLIRDPRTLKALPMAA